VAAITASLALAKAQAGKAGSLFVAGGAGGVGTCAIRLAHLLGVRNLITTAGSAASRAYLVAECGLGDDQIIDHAAEEVVAGALRRNGGGFDSVLDLVGGRMLPACCSLLAVDGNLASITEAPGQDDFERLFQKNASFHAIGANAYSLVDDRQVWRRYRDMLEQLAQRFDSGALAAPAVRIVGDFSVQTVRAAHALLESGGVQGKLVMCV
jgi:NADPH:quinone reductase